jgi:SAM-dependent methyltransferase
LHGGEARAMTAGDPAPRVSPHWAIRLVRLYVRLVSPIAFIARRFIIATARHTPLRQGNGMCLDVGAGTAPYRQLIQKHLGITGYVCFDIAPSDATEVVGDAAALPFPAGVFDLVVSFDVIQHVALPERMLDEMTRVAAPGAYLLLTFPFFYPECDAHDFRRWTMEGMTKALGDRQLDIIVSKRRGGPLFALACSLNWMVQHIVPGQRRSWRASRSILGGSRAALIILLTWPTTMLAWACLAADQLLPSGGLYMGGAILARKWMSAQSKGEARASP